jgi:hypothetical protein
VAFRFEEVIFDFLPFDHYAFLLPEGEGSLLVRLNITWSIFVSLWESKRPIFGEEIRSALLQRLPQTTKAPSELCRLEWWSIAKGTRLYSESLMGTAPAIVVCQPCSALCSLKVVQRGGGPKDLYLQYSPPQVLPSEKRCG